MSTTSPPEGDSVESVTSQDVVKSQTMNLGKVAGRSDPFLIIVIPTHNRWRQAKGTLSALAQSDYQNFEVVLIDDGCTDGTVEQCQTEFPDVHLLHGDGNLWWSGAINKGLEYALGRGVDAIVWLNDDNIVDSGTLSQMVASHQRQGGRSIICARTKTTGSELDEWAGGPPRWHPEFGRWSPPDLSAEDIAVKHPPGGRGVLIPAQCFREIGFVDSRRFPHYWGDHDFHYRAMKAGYKYFIARDAVVWNTPGKEWSEMGARGPGSLRGSFWFLFSRRSPMNIPTVRRLLKRHLSPSEYKKIFRPLLRQHLAWLTYEWASRKSAYKLLQSLKRRFSKNVSQKISQ